MVEEVEVERLFSFLAFSTKSLKASSTEVTFDLMVCKSSSIFPIRSMA